MGAVNGEYVGAIYSFKGSWQVTDYSTSAMSRAGSYLDTDGSSIYHAAVVKFSIPAFTGMSESVAFKMWANRMGDAYPDTVHLRYAICSADTVRDIYTQTSEAVTDYNQVASGTLTLTDVASASGSAAWQTLTIDTTALAAGTWYLVLWSAAAPSAQEVLVMQATSFHDSITLTYDEETEPLDPNFCPVSFRMGIAAGLIGDGWQKEVQ